MKFLEANKKLGVFLNDISQAYRSVVVFLVLLKDRGEACLRGQEGFVYRGRLLPGIPGSVLGLGCRQVGGGLEDGGSMVQDPGVVGRQHDRFCSFGDGQIVAVVGLVEYREAAVFERHCERFFRGGCKALSPGLFGRL